MKKFMFLPVTAGFLMRKLLYQKKLYLNTWVVCWAGRQ